MQKLEEQISFIELIEMLWEGKWSIIISLAIMLSIAIAYLSTTTPKYNSTIHFEVNLTPPFTTHAELRSKLKKEFYRPKIFEEWKKKHSNSILKHKDFQITKLVEGIELSKEPSELLFYFNSNSESSTHYLNIKSGKLVLINEIYLYLQYVNSILSSQIKQNIDIEYETLKENYQRSDSRIDPLPYERFKTDYNNGNKIFTVFRAKQPEKTSPNKKLILLIAAATGAVLGFLAVLIKNSHKFKQNFTSKS